MSISSTAGHKRTATEARLGESDRDYLQFTPLGGGCEVGRSCHILQFKGKTLMLDCIAEGTLISLPSLQLSVPIEKVERGSAVLSLSPSGALRQRSVVEVLDRGERDCIDLTFADGRTLTCTPEHRIRCADGQWRAARALVPGVSQVAVGMEYPHISLVLPAHYSLVAGPLQLGPDMRALLFCRLLGHLIADGSLFLSENGQQCAKLYLAHALDVEQAQHDVRALTGEEAQVQKKDDAFHLFCPDALEQAFRAWTAVGGRDTQQLITFPAFITAPAAPLCVVQEFLGGLFGGGGHALSYPHHTELSKGPSVSWTRTEADVRGIAPASAGLHSMAPLPLAEAQAAIFRAQLLPMLARCGVTDVELVADVRRRFTGEGQAAVGTAKDVVEASRTWELRVVIGSANVKAFLSGVGFRYGCDKQMRLTAATTFFRAAEHIAQERQLTRDNSLPILPAVHTTKVELANDAFVHASHAPWKQVHELTATQAVNESATAPLFSEQQDGVRFSHPKTPARYERPGDSKESGVCAATCGRASTALCCCAAGEAHYGEPSGSAMCGSKVYGVHADELELPLFPLTLLGVRAAGKKRVYDLVVPGSSEEEKDGPADELDSFLAAGIVVHNCGLHPAYSGIASLPYFDEINPADIDIILITQSETYTLTFSYSASYSPCAPLH